MIDYHDVIKLSWSSIELKADGTLCSRIGLKKRIMLIPLIFFYNKEIKKTKIKSMV